MSLQRMQMRMIVRGWKWRWSEVAKARSHSSERIFYGIPANDTIEATSGV